jgi:hypothetical protein
LIRKELFWWTLLAIAGIALVIVVYFALPGWLVGGELTYVEELKARNEVRVSGIQAVGAIAVVVGALLTARSYHLSRRGQIAERLSKAVEQLGVEDPTVQLGAIAALESIARSRDPDHYWEVMGILTSYLRDRAALDPSSPTPARAPAPVQAIVNVINGRDHDRDPPGERLDLSETDLRRVRLRDAHLENAQLSHASLAKAIVTGANARFDGAEMRETIFDGAVLDHAVFDRADLRKAKFRSQTRLKGSSWVDAKLAEVGFSDIDLSAVTIDLTDAIVGEGVTRPHPNLPHSPSSPDRAS